MEELKNKTIAGLNGSFEGLTHSALLGMASSSDVGEIHKLNMGIDKLMNKIIREKALTYTQLRNIYRILKNDEFSNSPALFYRMTIAKMAYFQGKSDLKPLGKNFISFLRELAIVSAFTENSYNPFIDIVTAMVAYHKLYN